MRAASLWEASKGGGSPLLCGVVPQLESPAQKAAREPKKELKAARPGASQQKAQAKRGAASSALAAASAALPPSSPAPVPTPAPASAPPLAPAPAPALSGEEAVRAKLAELNLSQFADKLVDEGVDSPEALAFVTVLLHSCIAAQVYFLSENAS
jgi:hypothetical protein